MRADLRLRGTLDPVAGGDGLVALIGAAVPVKTPLIGPPKKP